MKRAILTLGSKEMTGLKAWEPGFPGTAAHLGTSRYWLGLAGGHEAHSKQKGETGSHTLASGVIFWAFIWLLWGGRLSKSALAGGG